MHFVVWACIVYRAYAFARLRRNARAFRRFFFFFSRTVRDASSSIALVSFASPRGYTRTRRRTSRQPRTRTPPVTPRNSRSSSKDIHRFAAVLNRFVFSARVRGARDVVAPAHGCPQGARPPPRADTTRAARAPPRPPRIRRRRTCASPPPPRRREIGVAVADRQSPPSVSADAVGGREPPRPRTARA